MDECGEAEVMSPTLHISVSCSEFGRRRAQRGCCELSELGRSAVSFSLLVSVFCQGFLSREWEEAGNFRVESIFFLLLFGYVEVIGRNSSLRLSWSN